MSEDVAPVRMRTRAWVTKFDHSTDPPTPVEEVFVEDGVVREVRVLGAVREMRVMDRALTAEEVERARLESGAAAKEGTDAD